MSAKNQKFVTFTRFPIWLLRLSPLVVALLFVGPVVMGLGMLVLPAFGWWPALGLRDPGLLVWAEALALPGLGQAVWLSVKTGMISTLLALGSAVVLAASLHDRPVMRWLRGWLGPVLALPHAALALGFLVLLAPSGLALRLVSPGLTGWEQAPDLLFPNDPGGWALILALWLKELPFLLLMILAALGQVPHRQVMRRMVTLGYPPVIAWLKGVWPLLWPQMRLPVLAVLAYGTSVIDMALILAPSQPGTLAMMLLRRLSDPDLGQQAQAAVLALLLFGLVLAVLALWHGTARLARRLWLAMSVNGRRHPVLHALSSRLSGLLVAAHAALGIGALLALVLWSVAGRWRFPDAVPASVSTARWVRMLDSLSIPAMNSLICAMLATGLSLLLIISCLELDRLRNNTLLGRMTPLIWLPLLVPQAGFLSGVQIGLSGAGLDGQWPSLVVLHMVFVLPYMFLALSAPWRSIDPRLDRSATMLGLSPLASFWRVRLPLMFRPLMIAVALGMAVSLAQYLPTIVAGAGRLPTLATEAVAAASAADRRVQAITGLMLALMPMVIYAIALALPPLVWRNRRGMKA